MVTKLGLKHFYKPDTSKSTLQVINPKDASLASGGESQAFKDKCVKNRLTFLSKNGSYMLTKLPEVKERALTFSEHSVECPDDLRTQFKVKLNGKMQAKKLKE